MSEFLSSAAEKMGVPEALVRRSAEARAKAAGASTDDILAAWAGGEAAPAATPAPAAPEPEPEPEAAAPPDTQTPTQPEPVAAAEPVTAPAPVVAAGPTTPPILVGREERLAGAALGALVLAALSILVGFFVASTPEETNLAYTSEFAFSGAALDGQHVYRSQGCGACHTQVVRPLVPDAGLGGVTVADTNQIIGSRRIGPDLAHVGSRFEDESAIRAMLDASPGHPPHGTIGQAELDDLVAYLLESQ